MTARTSDSWAGAAADYTEAIRLARDTGRATELAMSLAGLSWLEARTGREQACREHAAETLALSGSREIHWAEARALFAGRSRAVLGGSGRRAVPSAATRHPARRAVPGRPRSLAAR
ncbi:hypothetical protein [Nocardioides sp. B-3]|uniref:hypothetical protein n=1 Tax=Nocardioides sp. B-3 TaxID=2895565 RepID=UPI002152DC3F|nr:hypothetical protein [Nocardioides sp. B-3]UUZ61310.1 hypothetical protein LP418_12395 [Nocardioides sp. B-3]